MCSIFIFISLVFSTIYFRQRLNTKSGGQGQCMYVQTLRRECVIMCPSIITSNRQRIKLSLTSGNDYSRILSSAHNCDLLKFFLLRSTVYTVTIYNLKY